MDVTSCRIEIASLHRAKRVLEEYKGRITTSEVTFIELMLFAKRYNLDPVKITALDLRCISRSPL